MGRGRVGAACEQRLWVCVGCWAFGGAVVILGSFCGFALRPSLSELRRSLCRGISHSATKITLFSLHILTANCLRTMCRRADTLPAPCACCAINLSTIQCTTVIVAHRYHLCKPVAICIVEGSLWPEGTFWRRNLFNPLCYL